MSESAPSRAPDNCDLRRTRTAQRRFRVSRNRGQARHRVRYIESGGPAEKPGACPLCPGEMNEQS